jgi:hypothetical protein
MTFQKAVELAVSAGVKEFAVRERRLFQEKRYYLYARDIVGMATYIAHQMYIAGIVWNGRPTDRRRK